MRGNVSVDAVAPEICSRLSLSAPLCMACSLLFTSLDR